MAPRRDPASVTSGADHWTRSLRERRSVPPVLPAEKEAPEAADDSSSMPEEPTWGAAAKGSGAKQGETDNRLGLYDTKRTVLPLSVEWRLVLVLYHGYSLSHLPGYGEVGQRQGAIGPDAKGRGPEGPVKDSEGVQRRDGLRGLGEGGFERIGKKGQALRKIHIG